MVSKTTSSWVAIAVAFCNLSWRRLTISGFDYSPAVALRAFAKKRGGGYILPLYDPC